MFRGKGDLNRTLRLRENFDNFGMRVNLFPTSQWVCVKVLTHSTPRPEGRGLLRVDSEQAEEAKAELLGLTDDEVFI